MVKMEAQGGLGTTGKPESDSWCINGKHGMQQRNSGQERRFSCSERGRLLSLALREAYRKRAHSPFAESS